MPTLYRNARVYTRAASPGAATTAFLVDGDTLVWLGSDSATDRPAGGAEEIDLGGAVVTPAFVDAHVHATATGLALTGLDLRGVDSLAAAMHAVEHAARAARGRPVLGGGWDETTWPERRAPTAQELDRASYGGVVYLARVDVHSAVASSALMASVPRLPTLAGFGRDGWQRGPAHDAVRVAAHDALTPEQRRAAQRAALQRAASLGVACVHEMAGPVISSPDDLTGLLALAAAEPLPEVIPYWAELFGIEAARDLHAVGAAGDLFCDGSLGSHTAALHEPYRDRPETRGMVRYETAEIAEHIVRCVGAGLQAGFHAIGDAAIDQVLDAFEAASVRLGRTIGAGHRLEHAEFVTDVQRLARSGLVASMQPCFDAAWGGDGGMYAERLGAERARRLNRFRDLTEVGVPLAFGSDAPVTELGPWAGVRAAVAPSDPAAGVGLEDAFAAHTIGGWRAAGRDGVGELRAGAPATFAIWDADPEATGLPAVGPGIAAPRCLATVLNGRVIHDVGLLSA